MKPHYLIFISLIFILSCKSDNVNTSLLVEGVSKDLAIHRKKQISEVEYNLHFQIPLEKEKPIVSHLSLQLNITDLAHNLYLDFYENTDHLQSLAVNGKKVTINHIKEHLIISSNDIILGKNNIEVVFIAGELSLNRNKEYLYTLLVPDRARTLFPCFDQPDIKANYTLNITAPKDWKVLCSTHVINEIEKGDFIEHQFGRSDKMSTYLFSFVAGKFESISQSPGSFDIQMLYRETNVGKIKSSTDSIFKLHQEALIFIEEYTKYPFPFQKLDFATIPNFQYGGMEHVGAIQYRESILFLDKSATESQRLNRGKLIAHETSHMWFGNLVTMIWFNDVWMKEVFANFMADKIMNPTFPNINHDLLFTINHYSSAYSEDRTLGTNPIRQKLNNLKNAGSLYGRIIYNKAPIMMRQLETFMGSKVFRDGMIEYIKTYAYENADWNDLVEILDSKSHLDLKKWSDVWVNQSGRPILTDQITYDNNNKIVKFEIYQNAEDGSDKVWPQTFDITLIYADSTLALPVSLTAQKISLTTAIGLSKPESLIYNSNGYGYGVFPMDDSQLDIIPIINDEVARAYSYINSYESTLNGSLTPLQSFNLYKNGLKIEKNELIIKLISGKIKDIFWKYFTPEERIAHQKKLEDLVYDRLNSNIPSDIKKTLFELFQSIAYSETGKERLYQIWNKKTSIPNLLLNNDDCTKIAMNLAIFQHEKVEEILESTSASITNPDKLKKFEFLLPSLSQDISDRDTFFESFKDKKNREKESWVLIAADNIHHPLRQDSAIKHLDFSLELLEDIQRTGDIFFPKSWLNSTIGNYSSKEAYEILDNFLLSHPNYSPVLKKKLLQATDDLYRAQKISNYE